MESSKQVGITEVVVRDGIQSLLATRVPLRDLVSILPAGNIDTRSRKGTLVASRDCIPSLTTTSVIPTCFEDSILPQKDILSLIKVYR